MAKTLKVFLIGLAALLIGNFAGAEAPATEPLKGLDDQVQEIKSEVLDIATELNLLEEKLLYPAHTEVAVFVSLAAGENFRLDSLDLALDTKEVAHHLYTYKELEALRKGGVQRLYTGHLTTGEHPLAVTLRGKTASGDDIEKSGTFTIRKGTGPGMVEIILTERVISFNNK